MTRADAIGAAVALAILLVLACAAWRGADARQAAALDTLDAAEENR